VADLLLNGIDIDIDRSMGRASPVFQTIASLVHLDWVRPANGRCGPAMNRGTRHAVG